MSIARRRTKQKRKSRVTESRPGQATTAEPQKYPNRPTVHSVISTKGLTPTACTARQRLVHQRLCGCRCGLFGVQQLRCETCDNRKLTFNACNDRHCGRCDDGHRDSWQQRIQEIILPIAHFHTVYTTPHELNAIYDFDEHNQRQVAALILECAQLTNQRLMQSRYDARIGQVAVLHTWNQKLERHVHVHTILTAGGLDAGGTNWITIPLTDRSVIRSEAAKLFRMFFLDRLRRRIKSGRIHDPGNAAVIIAAMAKHEKWIVNCQIPTIELNNPAALVGYVLYYAVGTAISDQRMLWDKDGEVGFKIKPRRGRDGKILKGSPRSMSLPKQVILDRIVSHILPMRFRRVRLSGLYATNEHARLAIARNLIAAGREPSGATTSATQDQDSIESEFSGDREGQTTYRVRCQKCVDKPPMHTEFRIAGHDTMRFLSFIVAMQMYYSGDRKRPPTPRPSGLPFHFASLEDFLSPLPSTPPDQQGTNTNKTLQAEAKPITPPLIKARAP